MILKFAYSFWFSAYPFYTSLNITLKSIYLYKISQISVIYSSFASQTIERPLEETRLALVNFEFVHEI